MEFIFSPEVKAAVRSRQTVFQELAGTAGCLGSCGPTTAACYCSSFVGRAVRAAYGQKPPNGTCATAPGDLAQTHLLWAAVRL